MNAMLIVLPDGHDCPRCGSWHAEFYCQHRTLGGHPSGTWNLWRTYVRRQRLLTDAFRCATCGHRFEGPAHDALEHRLACARAVAA